MEELLESFVTAGLALSLYQLPEVQLRPTDRRPTGHVCARPGTQPKDG
jgi:hypothetical protein